MDDTECKERFLQDSKSVHWTLEYPVISNDDKVLDV